MSRPSVYLAMPVYQSVDFDAAMMFAAGATKGGADIVWGQGRCSHPEHSFNECWANALNSRESHGLTHFAMLHADVVPEPYWLDKLLAIQAEMGADLVSVIIPIKAPTGYTSTALCVPAEGKRGKVERVLTMREVYDLPETFGPERFGRALLLNTGCFVCRLDADWCPKVWAQAKTWVSSGGGRGYTAHLWPSDWDFSLRVAEAGGRVLATRAVECYHGRPEWTNSRPWGTAGADDVAA